MSVDLAGGEFPMFTPAGVDASGSVGVRLGRGGDVAVLVGFGGAVADTLFPYPAELHVGAVAEWAVGSQVSPWRLDAGALATVSGGNTFVFPPDGSTTEVRGGRSVIEWQARVGVARYVRLADGPMRVWGGGGAFAAVRRIESSTLIFREGAPDEVVAGGDATTETRVGVSASLPIAVGLGRGMVLVLDPELRAGVPDVVLGGIDGQVTARLNL